MSKNYLLFGSIVIISIALASLTIIKKAESMQVKPLSEEDFSVLGVKTFELMSDSVFKKLGKPQEIKEVNGEDGRYKFYKYPSFTMITEFENGNIERIIQFTITKPGFQTYRGVTLGDDVKELFITHISHPQTIEHLIYL